MPYLKELAATSKRRRRLWCYRKERSQWFTENQWNFWLLFSLPALKRKPPLFCLQFGKLFICPSLWHCVYLSGMEMSPFIWGDTMNVEVYRGMYVHLVCPSPLSSPTRLRFHIQKVIKWIRTLLHDKFPSGPFLEFVQKQIQWIHIYFMGRCRETQYCTGFMPNTEDEGAKVNSLHLASWVINLITCHVSCIMQT